MRIKNMDKYQQVGILAALIVGLSAVLAAIIYIIPDIIEQFTSEPNIELVDMSVFDTKNPTIFDIEVKNTGKKPAFITKATFHVVKIYVLRRFEPQLFYVRPSTTYSVELPLKDTPYETTIDLSQCVKGNDVDRFWLTLGCKDLSSGIKKQIILIYEVVLKLYYNSDRLIKTNPLLFIMQPMEWRPLDFTNDYQDLKELESKSHLINKKLFKENINLLEQIDNRRANKGEGVILLINELSQMKKYLEKVNGTASPNSG